MTEAPLPPIPVTRARLHVDLLILQLAALQVIAVVMAWPTLHRGGDIVAGPSVTAVAFTHDGARLAAGDERGRVVMYHLRPGLPVADELTPTDTTAVTALATANGRIAAGHEDGTVRIWGASDELIHEIEAFTGERIRYLRFSPDGRWLLAGKGDATETSMNLQTRVAAIDTRVSRILHLPMDDRRGIAALPDHNVLTLSEGDGLRRWNLIAEQRIADLPTPGDGMARLTGPAGGSWFASASATGEISIWAPDGTPLRSFGGGLTLRQPWELTASGDGAVIARSDPGGSVALYQVGPGKKLSLITVLEGQHDRIALSRDGGLLASPDRQKVAVWDTASGFGYGASGTQKPVEVPLWALLVALVGWLVFWVRARPTRTKGLVHDRGWRLVSAVLAYQLVAIGVFAVIWAYELGEVTWLLDTGWAILPTLLLTVLVLVRTIDAPPRTISPIGMGFLLLNLCGMLMYGLMRWTASLMPS